MEGLANQVDRRMASLGLNMDESDSDGDTEPRRAHSNRLASAEKDSRGNRDPGQSDGVSWIIRQHGYCVFNYFDDFIGVATPESASTAFSVVASTLSSLGLQESTSKACPPATKQVCLGVEFDTNNFTLSVSAERLLELDALLDTWLLKRSTTKVALQSLIGKLVFVSKCVRQSRVFIARMLDLLRTVHRKSHHINLNSDFRKDLSWWKRFLNTYNGVSMINSSPWSEPGAIFTSDACLQGCGAICGNQYFHAEFPAFILSQALDILNALELLTIVVAAKLWGSRWKGFRIMVRCDNLVSVTVINSGRSKDLFLNECLRELCYLSAFFEFELRGVHLPGIENRACDLLSRWSLDRFASRKFREEFLTPDLTEIHVPDSHFVFDGNF
ncbi:hypothetical protein QZH41_012754 [Actinostola sp. cb2023]|nr:hypothetical protein QZH41_012754 [Actinostola sp. cb2023]